MKTEFLQNFKVGDQALPKEIIDAILAENGRDIEAAKKPFADYESVKEQLKTWQAKLDGMSFDGRIKDAITAAKGRNAKAITALLDVDALRASKNQDGDIKAALESLKKENGYLFDDDPPARYASGTGTQQMTGAVTKESFAKMGYRERLKIKQENPNLYEQVKE